MVQSEKNKTNLLEQAKSGPHLYFSPCFTGLPAGVSSRSVYRARWDGSGDSLSWDGFCSV